MSAKPPKIVPRNLTARAGVPVVGNPAIARPEDAVGNCYPGLEIDVRNLDRRFFPGLVFEFVARNDIDASYNDKVEYGARLAYLDHKRDPELRRITKEAAALATAIGDSGLPIFGGDWFLEAIEQDGKRIEMRGPREPGGPSLPLDGLYVWRLVRGLEPEPKTVTIELRPRKSDAEPVRLVGWRRRFIDPETDTISAAYQPGEMTQSLCSPWQHDFRDCACHYWAANRPDVVYARPSDVAPSTAARVPDERLRARVRVDWIRRERELEVTALDTIPKNRPYQLDHYEMNRRWQRLHVVVGDHEVASEYVPPVPASAEPYASNDELAEALITKLGPLEMTLALEYLYAMFSVHAETEIADGTLRDDVVFVRRRLKLIATSEMQHLRWVNELLWQLRRGGFIRSYRPVFDLVSTIPDGAGGHRAPALRPLTPKALEDFIGVERPSGSITGAYARVVATLQSDRFPPQLRQTAERIVDDGVDHATSFADMRRVLKPYGVEEPLPYLRDVRCGSKAEAAPALTLFAEIKALLKAAYRAASEGRSDDAAKRVETAREKMTKLHEVGEELARQGIGIPFWQ